MASDGDAPGDGPTTPVTDGGTDEQFRFSTTVPVRYRDLDPAGHVNNAVYASYVEQGRVEYLRTVTGDTLGTGNGALARLELQFEGPVRDPTGTVTVSVRTTTLGESSVEQAYRVDHDDERVATATATLVTLDPETGRPRPMPEAWRTALAEYEDL